MEDSVDTYLGNLETEELERVADRLLELTDEPGWVDLVRLAEVHRNKAVSQMVLRPMAHVDYAFSSGAILGMESFLGLVKKVDAKRYQVRERLNIGRQ